MALSEATALTISDQSAMEPCRILRAERAIEQDLACGGFEQIRAPDYFGDAHCRIVGDAGELITRHPITPHDDEVAEIFAGDEALRA